MTSFTRIISLDCGRQCSGVVVMDFLESKIVFMEFVNGSLLEYIQNDSFLKWIVKNKTLVIYENLYMPKLKRAYANWNVMRMQKAIRKYFLNLDCGVKVKAVPPSQKVSLVPGEFSKDRKKRSIESARRFLQDKGGREWKDAFEGLHRKHDVADALLAALYQVRK